MGVLLLSGFHSLSMACVPGQVIVHHRQRKPGSRYAKSIAVPLVLYLPPEEAELDEQHLSSSGSKFSLEYTVGEAAGIVRHISRCLAPFAVAPEEATAQAAETAVCGASLQESLGDSSAPPTPPIMVDGMDDDDPPRPPTPAIDLTLAPSSSPADDGGSPMASEGVAAPDSANEWASQPFDMWSSVPVSCQLAARGGSSGLHQQQQQQHEGPLPQFVVRIGVKDRCDSTFHDDDDLSDIRKSG